VTAEKEATQLDAEAPKFTTDEPGPDPEDEGELAAHVADFCYNMWPTTWNVLVCPRLRSDEARRALKRKERAARAKP
jgi:hypothetical protein